MSVQDIRIPSSGFHNATNAGTLRNIPVDGSAFSLSCDACGSAIGTVLNITTTDGIITGLSPSAMPPATGKRVNIRCAEEGATMITVPTSVSGVPHELRRDPGSGRLRTRHVWHRGAS